MPGPCCHYRRAPAATHVHRPGDVLPLIPAWQGQLSANLDSIGISQRRRSRLGLGPQLLEDEHPHSEHADTQHNDDSSDQGFTLTLIRRVEVCTVSPDPNWPNPSFLPSSSPDA